MDFGSSRSGRAYVVLDGRRTYVLDARNSGQPSRRFKMLVRTGRVTTIPESFAFTINPRTGRLIARYRAFTLRGAPRAWFRRASESATHATMDQAFGRAYREERVALSPPIRGPEITTEMLDRVVRERGVLGRFKDVLGTSAAKVYFSCKADMEKRDSAGDRELRMNEHRYAGGAELVTTPDDLEAMLDRFVAAVTGRVEGAYEMRMVRVMSVSMHVAAINPIRGSSYTPLPPVVARSQGVVNIKNDDQLCFLYSVAASLRLQEGFDNNNLDRVSHYAQRAGALQVEPKWFGVDSINTVFKNRAWRLETVGGEPHGMDLNSHAIRSFETKNEININVYGWEDAGVVPVRKSRAGFERTVQLFMHDGHFSVVRNFGRLCGMRDHVCPTCLTDFKNKESYERHVASCDGTSAQRAVMPSEGFIKFEQHSAMQRLPVVLYWDTESSIDPLTKAHSCISWRIRVVSDIPLSTPLDHVYVGSDAAQQLALKLVELERALTMEIRDAKDRHEEPELTATQEIEFERAGTCCYCAGELGDDRVRDHSHYTGEYRGAAHSDCNRRVRCSSKTPIPMLAHNSSGYDLHCLINELESVAAAGQKKIDCIATNTEQLKTLSIGNIKLIDSMAFVGGSLAKLIDALPQSERVLLHKAGAGLDTTLADKLASKLILPYSYITSVERLDDPLPGREAYKSDLTGEELSQTDYDEAMGLCASLGITTLRQLHDLYLRQDVMGLADVFESFRRTAMAGYGLDPVHSLGAPGLAWAAALKFTGAKLERLTDIDMYTFFEAAKRGGMSKAVMRHAKANNPNVEGYDTTKPDASIVYLDAANLYGHAMMRSLPTSDFAWVDGLGVDDVHRLCAEYAEESDVGYTLEVDAEFPAALHDKFADFPPLPVKRAIDTSELGAYQAGLLKSLNIKHAGSTKLVADLLPRSKYIVHIGLLKYALELGMKITGVHRAIKYTQTPWLRPYIEFNTSMRAASTHKHAKDFYKLMNNSVFGKTMENVRGRMNLDFVFDEARFKKQVSKVSYTRVLPGIGSESFRIIQRSATTVKLDKAIYAGSSILDLSKLHMYKFHYDIMQPRYGSGLKLIMTDTDSLLYSIPTKDFHQDLLEPGLGKHFDTSNLPRDHPAYSEARKARPGFFKDECEGRHIREVVALRAKSYCVLMENDKSKATQKGIRQTSFCKLSIDDYRACLFERKHAERRQVGFRSRYHAISTRETVKRALCPFDDKRHLLGDGCSSLPHGHWRIAAKAY